MGKDPSKDAITQILVHLSSSKDAHMGKDPSEGKNTRTDPTRRRNTARNCAPPDGAHSAPTRPARKIENILLDTSCPKRLEFLTKSSRTVQYDLTYCLATREETSPYCISPTGQPRIWTKIHRRRKTHGPALPDAARNSAPPDGANSADVRNEAQKLEIYSWIL